MKRPCAISAALNPPRLSGLYHPFLVLYSNSTCARFHSQRAHGCRVIHKVIALPQMDPRHPRPPDPRHPRRTRATTTRARRARWRRRILQGRRIFAHVARASSGSRQPALSHLPPKIVNSHLPLQLLSLGARTGILHSLSNGEDGTVPTLSDRFQLGGPTSLRMFRANSLGPRDGGAPFSSSTSHI